MDEPEPAVIEKTVSLQSVLEEASRGNIQIFEQFPIDVIRQECIKGLRRYHGIRGSEADWLEKVIPSLQDAHDPLGNMLLDWYLFPPIDREIDFETHIRALEFIISYFRKNHKYIDNPYTEISKLIAGKIRNDYKHWSKRNQLSLCTKTLYWHAPSVYEYLEKSLRYLTSMRQEYTFECWLTAERALRLILEMQDISFLPLLEQILELHEQGEIGYKAEKEEVLELPKSAILMHVVEELREYKKTQQPDLTATVGGYLREKLGFEGSVVVRLQYPDVVSGIKVPEQSAEVHLQIAPTEPADKERLASLLESEALRIKLILQGFTQAIFQDARIGFLDPSVRLNSVESRFQLYPSMGNNRFWIEFYGENNRCIAARAGYILCE